MKSLDDYNSYRYIRGLCEKYSSDKGRWRFVPNILPVNGLAPVDLAWYYENTPTTSSHLQFLIHSDEEFYEFSKEQLDYIEYVMSIFTCIEMTDRREWNNPEYRGCLIDALDIAGGVFDPSNNDLFLLITHPICGSGCVDTLNMRIQKSERIFTVDVKYDENCENSRAFNRVRNSIKDKKFESLAEIFNTLKSSDIQFGELCRIIGIQYDTGLSSLQSEIE